MEVMYFLSVISNKLSIIDTNIYYRNMFILINKIY
jgi:hypothetical protein